MISARGTVALLAVTAVAGIGTVAAPAHGADPPPPPIPTKLTPTPGKVQTRLQPVITSVHTLVRDGQRFTPTLTLRHGDKARFVMAWNVDQRSSLGAAGELEILKGPQVLYRRAMRGRSGAVGGILHADVRLNSPEAVGTLLARFTLRLGASAERSLSFTVTASSTKR